MMRVHEKNYGDTYVQVLDETKKNNLLVEKIKMHACATLVFGAFLCTLGTASAIEQESAWYNVLAWIAGTVFFLFNANRIDVKPPAEEFDDFEEGEDDD